MVLLTEVAEIEEYYRIKSLFEMKGVPIHTGNEDTARNFGVFHPVGKYAIHVLFEEQLDDARALLVDENHIIENPVDLSLYQEHKEANEQQTKVKILKVLLMLLVLMLGCVALIFFFFT